MYLSVRCNTSIEVEWKSVSSKIVSKVWTSEKDYEMNKFILIFINLILFTSIESARILLVHPSPSKSHLIVSKALMKELASRGHDVTVISSFPLEKPMKNYRDIYVPLQESIDRKCCWHFS